MVTRPTDHMISTRDHSHDLLTWSRHVTFSNTKSTSSHHSYDYVRVILSRPRYVYIYSQIPVVVAWEEVFFDRY